MTGKTTQRPAGSALLAAAATLQARWKALARREQTLVLAAGGVLALALVWWVALAPALHVLRTAPARHAALDAQLQHMQALQAEARQLQSVPRARSGGDALRALQTSLTQQLGAGAQLSSAGDRVTVTLRSVPADALARWLTQVRGTTRAVPQEARLTRSTGAESTPQAGVTTAATTAAARPAPAWLPWPAPVPVPQPERARPRSLRGPRTPPAAPQRPAFRAGTARWCCPCRPPEQGRNPALSFFCPLSSPIVASWPASLHRATRLPPACRVRPGAGRCCLLLGALPALAVFAPARWLAAGVAGASGGQVQLAEPRGTVWTVRPSLLLTGGSGSQDHATPPCPAACNGASGPPGPACMPSCAPTAAPRPAPSPWPPAPAGTPCACRSPTAAASGRPPCWPGWARPGTPCSHRAAGAVHPGAGTDLGQRPHAAGGLRAARCAGHVLAPVHPAPHGQLPSRALSGNGPAPTLTLSTLGGALLLQGSGQWVATACASPARPRPRPTARPPWRTSSTSSGGAPARAPSSPWVDRMKSLPSPRLQFAMKFVAACALIACASGPLNAQTAVTTAPAACARASR